MTFTSQDLTENLTLLLLKQEKDGEGGWTETWEQGPRLWASVWPLLDRQETPHYRIILRAEVAVPPRSLFLWNLRHRTKRLVPLGPPRLIQNNRFLYITVRENFHA
jgi:hypothetical protein